jgi:hypothetical protein
MIQVLQKDNKRPRLTIAKDRITLKLPIDLAAVDGTIETWVARAKQLARLQTPDMLTLRGDFKPDGSIRLRAGRQIQAWCRLTAAGYLIVVRAIAS